MDARRSSPLNSPLLLSLFLGVVFVALPHSFAFAQGAMTNGANHEGSISTPGELDEWTFTASINDAITLSIGEVVAPGPDPGFNPWIRLRRPDGVQIDSASGALTAQINITAPLSGTYTVVVASGDVGNDGLGDYRLTLAQTPGAFTVPGDDEGGALENGENHSGHIHLGDLDQWSFTAAQGDAITVSIGEVFPTELDPGFNPWIRLRSPTGANLGSESGPLTAQISVIAPLSGTYTVLVGTGDVGLDSIGDYRLTLAKTPGTFVVPNGDEGGAMVNGENHSGHIHLGDIDQWSFTAAQGDAITVSIGEVFPTELDPGFNPWIRLRSPTGANLGSASGPLTAQISDIAPLSGTYTVLVGTGDVGLDSTGDYRLTLAKTPGTFVVPNGDDGGDLVNGQNHSGHIHLGDLDQWSFTAAQGDAITVSIGEVFPTELDPGFNPWIRLRSPTGANLGSESGPLTAQISVIAPLSGTYTVLVGTGDVGNDSIGDYRLTLAKTPGTFVVPDGDEGGAMVNGANHSGHIHLGDLDQWSFTAAQGDAITVSIGEVFPTELDPGFNPWIRLRSPTGADLGSASGALTAQISVVAPLSGTYTVLVGTGDVGLDSTGDYRLTLAKTPGPFVVPDGDQGGAMSAGVNHPGAIHLGDLDMWTFCAAQGAALSISMSEILPSGPDPGFNPWIRLRAPSGQQLGSTSGSLVAQLNITASVTGLFTVLAGTGDVGSDAQGQYEIRVTGAIACPTGPTTVNDAYSTAANTALNVAAPGVLANDNPNGGGSMTAELVSNVTTGTLALNANGSFTFTPPNGFTGQASFTYRAVNAFGPGNVATVTLTVTQGTPPTTVSDAYGTNAGTPLNIAAPGVLGNDNSNGGGALTAELMSTTTSGVLVLSANGSFTYTPNPGFTGADSFTYRAVSSVGPGNNATVSITVSDPTTVQPPTALYASSIAGNTVTLRWTAPASGAAPTNYVIEGGVSPGQVLASLPVGNTTPIYTFPAPTGAFFVRVHTLSGASRSVASNEIRIFVNQPAAPSAPADLVGLVNGSSIALAWRNTFAGGAPGGIVLDVSGALTTSLPLGLTDSFQFNGVPGGTYTLSLRAINGAGSSPSSNAITLTFPSPCTGAPLPPSNFLAYRVGSTLFVVWDPATSGPAPTSYSLSVTGAFAGTFGTPGRTLSGAVGSGTYHLSVSASNACGASAATPVQTVVVP